MNERDLLLRAVYENPDDDTPRLVFADWLQEHDEEERAELIRVQCRLWHLDAESDEAEPLRRRADALLTEWYETWAADLPRGDGQYSWGFFQRGFLDEVAVFGDTPSFDTDLDTMFARTPLLYMSFLCERAAGRFVRSRHYPRVRRLYLHCAPDRELLDALTGVPLPPGLWSLTVRADDLTDADRATLRSQFGERVRGL